MTTCIQCQTNFEITDRDRKFYNTIGVPEPMRCPLCRRVRLLAWRNQRTLYRRKCQAPGHSEDIISIFAPDSSYLIYDRDYWWSDAWNPLDYGADIDFSRPFAPQFDALLHRVPLVGIFNGRSKNSAYTNHSGEMKDCYLTFASWDCERVHYTDMSLHDKDCMDCLEVFDSEHCYGDIGCTGSYGLFFSQYSHGCRDSWFLFDCKNCNDCIGCTNLRNKQYHIFNQAYAKEDYQKKRASLRLDTSSGVERLRQEFLKIKASSLHRHANLINCENVTGDRVTASKDCAWCFNADKAEGCSYCINVARPVNDVYDGYGVGAVHERGYLATDTGAESADTIACVVIWGCQNAYYSINCHNCTEVFGCYGLRGQKYCIFNKQYAKDEYERLKVKLIAHMRETGEWGEFFPPAISPFGVNETLAHEYQPMTKEVALATGFKWQDKVPGVWGKETISWDKIGETIKDVPPTITKEMLACQDCKRNYQIVSQELAFYKKRDIPIPRQCPECRYQSRLKLRNPHWLWHRQCACTLPDPSSPVTRHLSHAPGTQCLNEFETPYPPGRPESSGRAGAPERPERVFCESCYQSEVI